MLRANKVGVYNNGNVQSDPTSELRLQIDNSLYNNLEYDLTPKVYRWVSVLNADHIQSINL